MRFPLLIVLSKIFTGFFCLLTLTLNAEESRRPNLLFIAVDDLRPLLNCYGESWMVTPNIDRLASTARIFNRHYVQVATCGASRHALLTGLRPTVEADYGNSPFRAHNQDLAKRTTESFPHLFKQNGYRTVLVGKISHDSSDGRRDLPRSWTEARLLEQRWGTKHNFVNAYAQTEKPATDPLPRNKGYPFESVSLDDMAYPDGWIAQHAVEALNEIKDEPFLLAVGFLKPHLPFNAPAKYWDLYDPENFPDIPFPSTPEGVDARISLHPSFELVGQYDVPEGALENEDYIRKLRHGYCAAVSYVDAQIGKLLDELDRLKLSENTTIVLWGDHGWHLGDLGIWGKHTAFEHALRSPLIINIPGMRFPGKSTEVIVETVDIYPTLAELFGLTPPDGLGGSSLVSILNHSEADNSGVAIGYHRPWAFQDNPFAPGPWAKTIRTDRYRFTRWTTEIDAGEVVQIELYDHQKDPEESRNVARNFPTVVNALMKRLDEGL